jgi:hypothetical protein
MPHIVGKFSMKATIFLTLTSIGGLHKKLWDFKMTKVPISKISILLTWESQEK